MRRWALRVAYLGLGYHGFQRQPNVVTIEGRLLDALHRADVIENKNLKKHRYAIAARTDSGVSALEQTIAFSSSNTPNLNQINSYLPNSICVWAIAEVSDEFNPKSLCYSKTYEYHHYQGTRKLNLSIMRESAHLLEGTHNFRNFARYNSKSDQRFERMLFSVEIVENNPLVLFRFTAKAFLWEQCRRMVGHLLDVGLEKTSPNEPNGTLYLLSNECEYQVTKPTAVPPDGLLLATTNYEGIHFRSASYSPLKKIKFLEQLSQDLFRRHQVAEKMRKRISELRSANLIQNISQRV